MNPESKVTAVLFGHSHLGALIEAIANHSREDAPPGREAGLHINIFENWKYGGDCPYVVTGDNGATVFNPRFLAASGHPGAIDESRHIFTSFGGNAHNAVGLIQHERAFDFILPEDPTLPLRDDVEIIPSGYVAGVLEAIMEWHAIQLTCLRAATEDPVYHLETPPPLADAEFVQKHLDLFFKVNFETTEISSQLLRFKIWRLQASLQRSRCRDIGVVYIEAPQESMDQHGFLKTQYYGRDATHANSAYGELVLRQIETMTGATHASWSTFAE